MGMKRSAKLTEEAFYDGRKKLFLKVYVLHFWGFKNCLLNCDFLRPFFGFAPGQSNVILMRFSLKLRWVKVNKNCLFYLDFSLFLLYFAKIARFYWNLPISPLFKAQNRGNSAIGDISPAHIFHRQIEAQNRGFGEKSPEMATLI